MSPKRACVLVCAVAGCANDPPPPTVAVPAPLVSAAPPPPSSAPAVEPVASTPGPSCPPSDPLCPSGDSSSGAPSSGAPLEGVGNGYGSSGDPLAPKKPTPMLRQGAVQVNGRLPPEVIQRIVRQNFGRFRLCYEKGLRTDPKLAGRVSTKFTIDRSGAVVGVGDAGSDLQSDDVKACVLRAFGNLSFPQPEGGVVAVIFPVIFAPPAP